jgi:hypothetical protein
MGENMNGCHNGSAAFCQRGLTGPGGQSFTSIVPGNSNIAISVVGSAAQISSTLAAIDVNKTETAAAKLEGICSVTGGVANGVPPYIYGRDAAWVLKWLLSTDPKALHVIADSRGVNLQLMAGTDWTNVPLGGASAPGVVGQVAGVPYSMNSSVKGANAVHPSDAFPGENYEDYAFRGLENICIDTTARVPANNIWNILQGAVLSRSDVPLILARFDGRSVRCCWPIRLCTLGTVATRIAVQSWNSTGYSAAPDFVRSSWFATYAPINRLMRKYVQTQAASTIGATLISQLVYDGSANVLGEVIAAGMPWFELVEAYGATIHDWALGGAQLEDYVGESSYRVPNQFPDHVWEDEFRVRHEQRPPGFIIDLGTNGLQIDGFWMDRLDGAATLTRIIERLRSLAHCPSAPIILRSAYVTSANLPTVWWQQADLDVAKRLPNVALVDTYRMSVDTGGYAALSAKGWIGDGVHLNIPGRHWLEGNFNRMLVGDPVVAP